MSKETITLDNFADFQGEVHGVEIQSNLPFEPYVPSTEINVHLGRIARAARFGHLGSVAFSRYSEQSSVTAGVDSVGQDGSATASLSASTTQTPRMNSTVDPFRRAPVLVRGTSHIKINLGHDDMSEVNLRQAEPWAQYINKTVSQSLRACSNKKLLVDPGHRFSVAAPILTGSVITGVGAGIVQGVATYAEVAGFMNLATSTMSRLGGERAENSLFTLGLPFDRLGLVQAYTRTRKFVEAK